MWRSRHSIPKTSLEEILVLIRNEHANDTDRRHACCICSSEYCLSSSATTRSSSASSSVVTSTVTTLSSSHTKRTMSLGECKKPRGNTVFARDELEALFRTDSNADVEDGEEDEETTSSKRNDPSVGSRPPRGDDSDASSSKRSHSDSDRPLADAGPLSRLRSEGDSTPSSVEASRTGPVRYPWMPPQRSNLASQYRSAESVRTRDISGYTGVRVPEELKTLLTNLIAQMSSSAAGGHSTLSRAVGDYSSRSSFTPFGGFGGGGLRTPSPFPECPASGRSAAPTYRGSEESFPTNSKMITPWVWI
ncbi:unnamed protein product [Phytophthora fragariaefolia]|uniref:Unnamed protein product n=1 Tax=Phytophthora fragariaefolia TaxID=1490495 RepID=A0A9W6U7D2_9STRA|nr:unnamed protein product [Phytophthora fragariaefolia]